MISSLVVVWCGGGYPNAPLDVGGVQNLGWYELFYGEGILVEADRANAIRIGEFAVFLTSLLSVASLLKP